MINAEQAYKLADWLQTMPDGTSVTFRAVKQQEVRIVKIDSYVYMVNGNLCDMAVLVSVIVYG